MSNSTNVDYEAVMKPLRAAEERIASGDGQHGRCDFGWALLDYCKDSGREQPPSGLLNRISSELNVFPTVVNKRIEYAVAHGRSNGETTRVVDASPEVDPPAEPSSESSTEIMPASVVDAEIVGPLDEATARALTDQIKTEIEVIWDLVARAYTERAWEVLGYSSWDDYCDCEFGTSRLRLPREQRTEVISSLRESGLSVRAISAATGDGVGTVHRALSGVPNGTPQPTDDREGQTDDRLGESSDQPQTITGRDGKTYPATPKQEPHEAETEVEADEELPRCDLDQDFDEDVDEDDDSPATHRFRGSRSVFDYVEQVAAIGLESDNGVDIDLVTPLTADDLPADLDGSQKWTNRTDADVARRLADRLRAALPRIEELLALLDRRAKDGADDAA